MTQLFTNNAISLLQTALSSSATTIELQPGLGSLFPQPIDSEDFFLVTLETVDPPFLREIVRVEGRAGDTLVNCVRAQEGTSALNWSALNTLVDHRITADTIRQAFIQPESRLLQVEFNSDNLGTTETLVFTGPGVIVTDNGSSKTVNITSGGWINGDAPPATLAAPMTSTDVDIASYYQNNRMFKYLVTVLSPTDGRSQSMEVLANVQGIIGSGAETVIHAEYAKIGYPFNGNIVVSLNHSNREVVVSWNSQESIDLIVNITRIQHAS